MAHRLRLPRLGLAVSWMRTAHPTIDGLSRSEFVRPMYEALGQAQDARATESEALAASFGL